MHGNWCGLAQLPINKQSLEGDRVKPKTSVYTEVCFCASVCAVTSEDIKWFTTRKRFPSEKSWERKQIVCPCRAGCVCVRDGTTDIDVPNTHI